MNTIADDVKLADCFKESIYCELKVNFFLKNKIIKTLSSSEDAEIKSIAKYVKKCLRMPVFPYDFPKKYSTKDIEVKYDHKGGKLCSLGIRRE